MTPTNESVKILLEQENHGLQFEAPNKWHTDLVPDIPKLIWAENGNMPVTQFVAEERLAITKLWPSSVTYSQFIDTEAHGG